MDGWRSIFQNFIIAIDPATQNPQHWRFLVALGVLVVGFFLLEILFRSAMRRIQSANGKISKLQTPLNCLSAKLNADLQRSSMVD